MTKDPENVLIKRAGVTWFRQRKQRGDIREFKCLKYCCRGKMPSFRIQCKKLRVWNAVRDTGVSQKGGPKTSESSLALQEESRLAWGMGESPSIHGSDPGKPWCSDRSWNVPCEKGRLGDLCHGWEIRPLVLLICISLCKMRTVHSGPLYYLKSVGDYEEIGCFRSKGKETCKHLELICSLLNV